MRIAQDPLANAQHHPPVPFDQHGERRLGLRDILPGQESPQELTVTQLPGPAQVVERPEWTGQKAAGSFTSHRDSPFKPRFVVAGIIEEEPARAATIPGFFEITRDGSARELEPPDAPEQLGSSRRCSTIELAIPDAE